MLTLDRESRTTCVVQVDATAIALPRGELTVGRSSANFLRIDDPSVSRIHLKLTVGDEVIAEDLGSANGTLVNDEPLSGSRRLVDGDRIRLGNRLLLVQFVDPTVDLDEEATPAPAVRKHRSTQQGLGAVGQVELGERCPRCNEAVAVRAESCPRCGFRWPKGQPEASTSPENPVVLSRRRNERHPVQLPVRYTSEALAVEAEATNISLGGVFVAAGKLDPVGSTCTLEFPSNDRTVVLRGFVRHVIHRGVGRTAGMGIEFCAPDETAIDWLAEQLRGRRNLA
jgi:predicted component of type VI protein secretion system